MESPYYEIIDEIADAEQHLIGNLNPADFGLSDDDETDDEEDEDDEDDEEYVPAVASPRVTHEAPLSVVVIDESQNFVEEEGNKRRRTEGGEASCSFANGSVDSSQENEWNRTDVDGLVCPICMDAWTNNGEHCICCLPCGHIYGMSCIKKWLQHRKNSAKCPQCKMKCSLKDVRKLYASQVVAVEEESQKRILSLEAKCAALESK